MFELVPVKNQKFEIGRTINPFKCDCEECTFMNCPKHNYCVKMTKRIWKLGDFWEEFKDEILAINKPDIWQYSFHHKYDLELNHKLLNEFVDMLFSFPKGTYWSPENYKWHTDDTDIDEVIYRRIDLQKISRKGNTITLASIVVGNGKYDDFDLSVAQEKLAIKISNALKELKELVFAHYQERDKGRVVGWLSPTGRHYPCRTTEHSKLAFMLGGGELSLETQGWVKVATSDIYFKGNARLTAEQRNWLSLNGFELDE